MKIEIRGECVHISGYVNAVGRDSRPIPSQTGKFVEMIEPGTFGKALERAENVDLLLNHNKDRKLGSTSFGNLALNEDSIGLRAEADIKDAEVVEKARSGKLRGWSFGMYVKNAQLENRAEDIPRRHVREIDLFEVSLIDDTMNPCYIGTSVECRADTEQLIETRGTEDSHHEINEIAPPDYSDYEGRINGLRAMGELRAYEERLQELRYNPYHDPTNGRFTGPNGAGGGMLFVGKGQKGKGAYVFGSNKGEDFDDEEYSKWAAAKNGSTEKLKIGRAHTQSQSIYNLLEKQDGAGAVEVLKEKEKKYKDFSVELDVPKINGKSEKQINYASDLRRNEINSTIGRVEDMVNNIRVDGQSLDLMSPNDKVAAELDKRLQKSGMKNVSELTSNIVMQEHGDLLKMSDAKEIIDYCLNPMGRKRNNRALPADDEHG